MEITLTGTKVAGIKQKCSNPLGKETFNSRITKYNRYIKFHRRGSDPRVPLCNRATNVSDEMSSEITEDLSENGYSSQSMRRVVTWWILQLDQRIGKHIRMWVNQDLTVENDASKTVHELASRPTIDGNICFSEKMTKGERACTPPILPDNKMLSKTPERKGGDCYNISSMPNSAILSNAHGAVNRHSHFIVCRYCRRVRCTH